MYNNHYTFIMYNKKELCLFKNQLRIYSQVPNNRRGPNKKGGWKNSTVK